MSNNQQDLLILSREKENQTNPKLKRGNNNGNDSKIKINSPQRKRDSRNVRKINISDNEKPSFLFTVNTENINLSPRKSNRVLRKRPSELCNEPSSKRNNNNQSPISSPTRLLSRSSSRLSALRKTISKSVTQRNLNLGEYNLDLSYPISLAEMLKNVILDNKESWKLFILSYVHFKWTPREKFRTLKRFYKSQNDLTWMNRIATLKEKTKILMYLSDWIQLSLYTDFNFSKVRSSETNSLVSLNQYSKFLEYVKNDGLNLKQLNIKLPSIREIEINIYEYSKYNITTTHIKRCSLFRGKNFIDEPTLFSHQLALYEFQLFKKVKPKELVNQAWNKSGKEENAPNVTRFIKHFNVISKWITSQILDLKTDKEQAKSIEKFITIAKKSKSRGNFNGVMEIISSLSSIQIQQLQSTWKLVSDKSKAKLKKLECLMSPFQNFRNYRQKIETWKGFLVPYVGVHLGDIVHLMEGYLETTLGYYDTQKVLQLGSYLVQWRSFQEQQIFINEDYEFTKFLNRLSA